MVDSSHVRPRIHGVLTRACVLVAILVLSALCTSQAGSRSLYLRPTRILDSNHPAIIGQAAAVTRGLTRDADRARALFEFVRDSHNGNRCDSFVASDILRCGGNLCYQRSILLAALARAVGIPSRLHLQEVTLHNWRSGDSAPRRVRFAHGVTGLLINGRWRRYETVGNAAKWVEWTGDPTSAREMPVPFSPYRDCLFTPNRVVGIESLPYAFPDRTGQMVDVIASLNRDLAW